MVNVSTLPARHFNPCAKMHFSGRSPPKPAAEVPLQDNGAVERFAGKAWSVAAHMLKSLGDVLLLFLSQLRGWLK
jgi:hypothetical protein